MATWHVLKIMINYTWWQTLPPTVRMMDIHCQLSTQIMMEFLGYYWQGILPTLEWKSSFARGFVQTITLGFRTWDCF
jgi:hypothetical protein